MAQKLIFKETHIASSKTGMKYKLYFSMTDDIVKVKKVWNSIVNLAL
jgi:hypothetical protein